MRGLQKMSNRLVRVAPAGGQVAIVDVKLLEREGGAARFAWEGFFLAEQHNLHTQRAYESAVRRFLTWAEGQRVELALGQLRLASRRLLAVRRFNSVIAHAILECHRYGSPDCSRPDTKEGTQSLIDDLRVVTL